MGNRNFCYLPLALLPLAITASMHVQADDTQLTTMVVSAAGFEQKITDAPASISVISAEELRSRPYTSLLDAVRELEGVDVGETRDKTGQGTISMRGMGSDYTLVLIDGRRQNNHGDIYPNNFGGNQFNHIPPLDAIERIEVIRGPASTLYGADALGGVINIITKKVTEQWSGSTTLSHSFQEKSEYGSDSTLDLSLMGPLVKDKLGLALRGSYYLREGSTPELASVTDPLGVTRERSLGFGSGGKTVDNTNYSFGSTLNWKVADKQNLALNFDRYVQSYDNDPLPDGKFPLGTVDSLTTIWRMSGYCDGADATKQASCTAAGGTWVPRADPRVGYRDQMDFTRTTWSLTHDAQWSFGNSWISFEQVTTSNEGRTLPFNVAERQQLLAMMQATGAYAGMSEAERKAAAESAFLPRSNRVMESQQYVLDAKLDMPFELLGLHTAVLGAQITQGKLTDSVFGLESSSSNEAQEHNMWSVFAEDTWYVLSPLALTVGARYDNHEVFGSQVSPRLYAVYNFAQDWALKGGVSTGFKTPNTTDLYDGVIGFGAQGALPLYGNPDLKPETSVSKEVALYWQHGEGSHNANLTYFENTFKDKISSEPCGVGTSYSCASTGDYSNLGYANSSKEVNIDEVAIKGVEFAARVQLLQDVALRANYTYTDSEQKSGANEGKPFGNIAKHMANATLDWQVVAPVGVFLTLEARDKRYRSWDLVNDKALYYKGYEVLHLGFNWQILDNLRLGGRVNNLLDKNFTGYDALFDDTNGDGDYADDNEITYRDDYNNKDKRRSYWLSLNLSF